MKTIEEIENKANDWLVETPIEAWGGAENGFIKGYTQCQEDMADKKYTEEDIRKVIDETIKACNISQKESYGDLEIDTDKIINSLNKKDK